MPIQDGDVATREKIAKGLEDLRFAYGEKGYLNFTCIPDTILDDETNALELNIDLDEGGQFTFADLIVSAQVMAIKKADASLTASEAR